METLPKATPGEWLGGTNGTPADAMAFALDIAREWECRVVLRCDHGTAGQTTWDVFAA